jgi:hypothetical protein
MSTDSSEPETVPSIKICKEARYYYRHREEILAKRREKKLADTEYANKLKEKEEKRAEKERLAEARRRAREEKRLEKQNGSREMREAEKARKREEKARLVGALR